MQKSDDEKPAKITALIPRALWARTKAFAVLNQKSAQQVIIEALEAHLRQAGGQKR